MKNGYCITLLIALTLAVPASADIIKLQSFEKLPSDTWAFSTNPESYYNEGSYSIFHRDSVGFPGFLADLPDGDKLWNCENTGYTNTAVHEITFNTIDISSYTGDLSIIFNYFAFKYKDNVAGDDPWTSSGYVLGYYVEFDNGSTWNTLVTLSTGTDGWTPVKIDIPDGSDYVRLRFVVKNYGWQEIGCFDYVYLEMTEPPTPICLTSFIAKEVSGGVELNWATETETENKGFNLYRAGELITYINGAGTSSEPHSYTYFDDKVIPGQSYCYVLADISYANIENRFDELARTISIKETSAGNLTYEIQNAYPNPFNPTTTLEYELFETASVEIGVYNMTGDRIAILFNGEQPAGNYHLQWNASDMESGIYLLKSTFGNLFHTQKLLLVK